MTCCKYDHRQWQSARSLHFTSDAPTRALGKPTQWFEHWSRSARLHDGRIAVHKVALSGLARPRVIHPQIDVMKLSNCIIRQRLCLFCLPCNCWSTMYDMAQLCAQLSR
jgi:hypothetical protein